jgi:signal transduction histidine kinase
MWTRLVAGAAAHDINNLAQGLTNLLSLASAPTASREALDRYAALARDGIRELRQLGTDLRALSSPQLISAEPHRLDLLAVEAVGDLEPPADRSLDVTAVAVGALVAGPGAPLRLAIQSIVRYALAASPPGGGVAVSVALDGSTAAVIVSSPTAPGPRTPKEAELGALLAGPEREFGGDAGLVLAGAAAHLCGGWITAGPGPAGGLRFKLSLPRAEEAPQDAGPA